MHLEQALLEEQFSIEERNIAAGKISAVSPIITRHIFFILPLREEQWRIHVLAALSPTNTNHVVVTAQAQVQERGILPSSQWRDREQARNDEAMVRNWLGKLDQVIIKNGGTPE